MPKKLDFLLGKKARYKVPYGGRAGLKSWSISRALLTEGLQSPRRYLCARELQRSIKDSVHQLLCDQISLLNMGYFYKITQKEIIGINGTQFGFAGLKFNAVELKSYEGADRAWVEEGQVVSKRSWDILTPTIRKEDSEIWVSFNPDLEDDETYQRFIVKKRENSIVQKVSWRDNPWLTDVLKQEIEQCRRDSPDDFLHIWEGHCKQVLEGAIFANELRQAKLEDRITTVPHDKTKPVHTYWDLGWNSITGRTSIIMAQGFNIIDYMEDAEHTVDWYVQKLRLKPYVYGTDYLPHDANSTNLAAGGKTVKKIMEGLGRTVKVLKRTQNVGNDINAAKTIFNRIKIDRDKCSDLLQCLNRYKYKIDPDTGLRSKNPEPNIYIHGADSFRQYAVAAEEEKRPVRKRKAKQSYRGAGAWMG